MDGASAVSVCFGGRPCSGWEGGNFNGPDVTPETRPCLLWVITHPFLWSFVHSLWQRGHGPSYQKTRRPSPSHSRFGPLLTLPWQNKATNHERYNIDNNQSIDFPTHSAKTSCSRNRATQCGKTGGNETSIKQQNRLTDTYHKTLQSTHTTEHTGTGISKGKGEIKRKGGDKNLDINW